MSRAITALAVALLTIGTLAPPAAVADEPQRPSEAQRLFERGKAEFEAGRTVQAIEAFEAAYEHEPRPELLVNLAQCYRALGQASRAIEYLEQFIAAAPRHPLRAAAERTIDELRPAATAAKAPRLELSSEGGARDRAADPRALAAPSIRARPAQARSRSRLWLWSVGIGVAVVAGSAAIYFATRPEDPPVIGSVPLPPP